MVRRWLIVMLLALPLTITAQEVLLPLQHAVLPPRLTTKTAPTAVSLPFFDDFANGIDATLWQQDGGTTVTVDVSPFAPTVGVATLDALDAAGDLYPQASTSVFPADTLMSLPVRLDGLGPADSVALTFYYLPGGGYGNMWERMGDGPDTQDSLFLDFYCPADSTWVMMWCCGGVSVDTLMARTGGAWQYVVLPITDSVFFDSTFRFRFRNHASLESSPKAGRVGNCDFWHLDYVVLDRGRDTAAIPVVRDVAFAAPAPTMLRHYRAMPYWQYTASDMVSALQMTITNLYSSPLASQYTYTVLDSSGATLHHYDGGFENAPPHLPGAQYQTAPIHASPSVSYAFPAMTAPTAYTVVHIVREGTAGDAYPRNDTVRYRQLFDNYYAYDDGSAENGYGLTSTASQLFLAYRFDLNSPDTLTAVDLFFNRTLDDGNMTIPFYLTVWSVGDNGAPDEVLYRDTQHRLPHVGGFQRYELEVPTVCSGSLFVGFEQTGSDYINLGFDRSFNTYDRIWYHTGTEWQQSIHSGSLMLRPCFGATATVGMENPELRLLNVTIYPNPVSDKVHIDGLPYGSRIELYDTFGRLVYSDFTTHFSLLTFPNGLYLLRVVTPSGEMRSVKLIIKH
ncbi:MAG: T9SS type A sorting domain-containing protein [Bacteroidales bacterium]|nr:T9SS type A sorting domain-containing protein [Bacteroidales bacterium]